MSPEPSFRMPQGRATAGVCAEPPSPNVFYFPLQTPVAARMNRIPPSRSRSGSGSQSPGAPVPFVMPDRIQRQFTAGPAARRADRGQGSRMNLWLPMMAVTCIRLIQEARSRLSEKWVAPFVTSCRVPA